MNTTKNKKNTKSTFITVAGLFAAALLLSNSLLHGFFTFSFPSIQNNGIINSASAQSGAADSSLNSPISSGEGETGASQQGEGGQLPSEGGDDGQTPSIQENQNNPPKADAGQDQEIVEGGGAVVLEGSGSTDTDGQIVSYQWRVEVQDAPEIILENTNTPTPSFAVPVQVSQDTNYGFVLEVTDNNGAVATDSVNILIKKKEGVQTQLQQQQEKFQGQPQQQAQQPSQGQQTSQQIPLQNFSNLMPFDIQSGSVPTFSTTTGKAILNVMTKVITAPGISAAIPGDFTILVSGTDANPLESKGSESGTAVSLGMGEYDVSVVNQPAAGYFQQYSGDCKGTINAANETKTCTITNNSPINIEFTSTIEVTKIVSPPLEAGDIFTMEVKGAPANPSKFGIVTAGTGTTSIKVIGGNIYEIIETSVPPQLRGYTTTTYSDGCKGSIGFQETKKCIIENKLVEAALPPKEPTPLRTYPPSNPNQCLTNPDSTSLKANAGPDQTVKSGDKVTLDGSASTGPIFRYIWVTPSNLRNSDFPLNSNVKVLGFTAPQVTNTTVYTLQLIAYDNEINCSSDIVDIVVEPATTTTTAQTLPFVRQLKVITKVINDNGGNKLAKDFNVLVKSPPRNDLEFGGSKDGYVIKLEGAASRQAFQVTQTNCGIKLPSCDASYARYATTYSGDCDVHWMRASFVSKAEYVCTIINNDRQAPFNIVAFGDSVMWGQGLTEQQKFHTIVAKHLQEKFEGEYRVQKIVKAHSGAVIGGDQWPPSDDEVSKEYVHKDYIFRWDKIPGEDEDKLRQFLAAIGPGDYSSGELDSVNWYGSKIVKDPSNLVIKIGPIVPRSKETICYDGKDNDADGKIDGKDKDCSSFTRGSPSTIKKLSAEFRMSTPTSDILTLEFFKTSSGLLQPKEKYEFNVDRRDTGQINILFRPLHGEINTSYPTILQQVTSYKGPAKPKDVNLVLVGGCINDVGAFTIASPLTHPTLIKSRAINYCYEDMKDLLFAIQNKFFNAKIIVTGYWQGVSKQSYIEPIMNYLLTFIYAWVNRAVGIVGGLPGQGIALLLETALSPLAKSWAKDKMIQNWKSWKEFSTRYLSQAVSEINQKYGCPFEHLVPGQGCPFEGKRISLAIPDIRDENAIFACGVAGQLIPNLPGISSPLFDISPSYDAICSGAHPNIFGFKLISIPIRYLKDPYIYYKATDKLPIRPIDSLAAERGQACKYPGPGATIANGFDRDTCPIASAFHPNPEGSWKFAEAIIRSLPSEWENRNTFEDMGTSISGAERMRRGK
jgi:hypothetical protein